jgi:formate dehydrogenase subunit gamma
MLKLLTHLRALVPALLLCAALAAPAVAQTQRNPDSSVNPTASSVSEDKLFQELNRISGRCTIPDQKACTIEQPAGREWREFRMVALKWIGGIAILGMILVLAIFYLWRGPMRVKAGFSGIKILRFDVFERFVHWLTASTFIVLGITGLNISFGRSLLLPLMGLDAFSTWSEWAKFAHNYLSFAFTVGAVLMLVMWIGRNLPTRADVEWVKVGGGMFDKSDATHAPAWKFNAGQKILYWLVMLASLAMIISGFILLFPFYYGLNIGNMQLAEVFHGAVAMLFVSLICAHIYLGTIGMEGAFEAMSDGNVDLNWAEEHHNLWLQEERQKGAIKGEAMRPAE